MDTYVIEPIDPVRLDRMRAAGTDEHGNPWRSFAAGGGEPLRCCLRNAVTGEDIALISYSPWTAPSPWREVGPVFVHASPCPGYRGGETYVGGRRRILRPYHVDGSMAYGSITVLEPADDPGPVFAKLLADPSVAVVHVRTELPQCFLAAVRVSGPGSVVTAG